MSYVFRRVPSSIKLRPEKRFSHLAIGWNVWGSMSLDCFGRFLDQITTEKKGTVVWPLVAMSDCFGGFVAKFFGRFLDQITNYDRKKRHSCLAIGWNVYYVLLTYYTLVDRPSAMTLWGIYPGRKILALTWGLLVPSTRRGLKKILW